MGYWKIRGWPCCGLCFIEFKDDEDIMVVDNKPLHNNCWYLLNKKCMLY